MKKPLSQKIAAAYFIAKAGSIVRFKKGLPVDYPCKKHFGLVSCFGFEGDKDAPIAFVDGSYLLRDRMNEFITFGFGKIDAKVRWYNAEGWLPCLVSEFESGMFCVKIENFADRVKVGGNKFVIAYSRVTIKNILSAELPLPKVSRLLIPLNDAARATTIQPNQTLVRDYAVGADRFGGTYRYPKAEHIASMGGFDYHYNSMKRYWTKRVSALAQITKLPDERLINAYKAGYVYMMIVKDGCELHVGENGYDRVFDHDVIGILAALITQGDFRFFKHYVKHILLNRQYPDARWKYPWVFALWLLKTGDKDFVTEMFGIIRESAHSIQNDITEDGIIRRTNAIDSYGLWTIDNQSALTGLASYAYICSVLGKKYEESWARELYDALLKNADATLGRLIESRSLNYLPIAMDMPNEEGSRFDPKDANQASMFLFGRWSWEAYLLGAPQYGVMLDKIDDTYDYIIARRQELGSAPANFGGYPHGFFSSAYNAGYGAAALRGERHRDIGIKAYEFMIENSMSGPYSWWEGIDYPSEDSIWDVPHAAAGGGSCPHIWGQSTATKVLLDSLICERFDGSVIIGRGVPREWLAEGAQIEVCNYPVSGGRMGFNLTVNDGKRILTLTGDTDGRKIIDDFPLER